MTHTPLKSSMLRSAAHEGDTLEVVFSDGATYRYQPVPREAFDGLLAAESAGKYFRSRLRGLKGVKVPPQPTPEAPR